MLGFSRRLPVLRPRVAEINAVLAQGTAMPRLGSVVDDGGVRTNAGDGWEAETHKVLLLSDIG